MRFVKEAKIDSLKPMEGNPRLHTDIDVDAVVKSMDQFGWTNPILVQEKTSMIVAGHGRLMAAKKRGLKVVPVVYLDIDDINAKAYSVADNQIATLSAWDQEALGSIIEELKEQEFDCDLLGFDAPDLQSLSNVVELGSELDESIADNVALCICASCGHEHHKDKNK